MTVYIIPAAQVIATKGVNLKLCALIKMNCFISLLLSLRPYPAHFSPAFVWFVCPLICALQIIYEPPPPRINQTADIFVFNRNLFFNFVLLPLPLSLLLRLLLAKFSKLVFLLYEILFFDYKIVCFTSASMVEWFGLV